MKKLLFLFAFLSCLGLWSEANAQDYTYSVGQAISYNGKNYKVAGANIVANGDFADGTYAGWVRNDDGNAVVAEAWEISSGGPNGAKYLHCTGAKSGGSGSENNIRCAWELEAGKAYLVSYWTKGSNDSVRFWNSAQTGYKSPDNNLALLVGSASTDWVQSFCIVEATEEAHKALLNCAWCGNGFGLTYICIMPLELVGEEPIINIDPNVEYNLQIQGTELYLAAGWQDNAQQVLMLNMEQSGYEKVFSFVPVEGKDGVYNLIGQDGKAIYANGSWNCHWNSAPTEDNLASAEYQFTVVPEHGYIMIHTKNNYIGSNGVADWTKVYTDKGLDLVVKFVPVKVATEPAAPTIITDVLTYENTVKNNSGTGYVAYSDVSFSSDAVYAYQAANGNTSIQLRSTSPSGIITTATGGTVKKVTITYNENTANTRTLDIYASNTAYAVTADLYDTAKQGTKVASLKLDNTNTYTYTYEFTSDYQYIGMRSAGSAMYIDKIEIEWEVAAGEIAAPTFDPAPGMVKSGTEVTMSTQAEGAEIYYTIDGTDPTAASTKYTAPVAIYEATTFKAVAIANGNASKVVTAEYSVMPSLEDLSPLTDLEDKTKFTVDCELTVVYVNGANVYVYDGVHYGLIYKNNLGLAAGDVIAAGWEAQLSIYAGLYEIVPQGDLAKSESAPKAAQPTPVSAEDAATMLAAYNMNRYFTLEGVVFAQAIPSAKENFTGKLGEMEVPFRNNFTIEGAEAGTYDVTGFLSVYNTAIQFLPIAYAVPENVLWKSDVEAEQSTADWRRVFTMTAEECKEQIAVGDYLLVTVSYVDPEGGWPQVAVLPIEGWPPYVNEGVSKTAECPFVVKFPIAGPTAKQMYANGFGVSGGDVLISKVVLEKATEELSANTVWFGGKQCGWGNGISISKDVFADCKAGDKVVINYTPGNEATLQIMPGGWSGPNFPIYAGLPFFVRDEAANQMIFTLQEDFDAFVYEVDGEDKTFDIFTLLKSDGLMMHGPCYVNSIEYIPAEVETPAYIEVANIAGLFDLTEEQMEENSVKLTLTDAKVTYYAENAGTIFVEDATAAMQLYVMTEDFDYAEIAELAQGKAVTGTIIGSAFEGGMFMALDTDVDITSSVDADVTTGTELTLAQAMEPANVNKLVTFTASADLAIATEEGMLMITEGESHIIVSDPFYSLPEDYEFPEAAKQVTGVIVNYGMIMLAPRSEADIVPAQAEPELIEIEPNVYYNLQIVDTDPALYLSAGWQDNNRQINTLELGEAGYEQAFKFVPVEGSEGVYNLIGADGKAVYEQGGWDCFWNDAPSADNLASAEYQFTVESQLGYILIHGKNGYLGSDGIKGWSKIWTDKGLDKAVKFVPVEATVEPDGIEAIEAAEGEATYYSLQGVRLNAPAKGQPCIRVANGKATKVIVK